MENIENSFPEQQENITPPQAGTSFLKKLKSNWPIVLGALGSFTLFTAIIYGVYSYSKRGEVVQPSPTPTVTPTSTIILTPTPTSGLTPAVTTSPEEATLIPTPTASPTPTPLPFQGKVAFIRGYDVWILSSSGEQKLTSDKNIDRWANFAWSNDGSKLVFRVDETDNTATGKQPSSTWIMNVDGNNQEKILYLENERPGLFKFSPDDSKIAFGANGNLKYIDLSTKEVKTLRQENARYSSPAGLSYSHIFWSSDGNSIFFHNLNPTPTPTQSEEGSGVYSLQIQNPEVINPVVVESCFSFAISHKGTRLVYHKVSNDSLWLSNIDGSNKTEVTEFGEIGTPAVSYKLEWSPDDEKIALLKQGDPGYRIFVYSVSNRNLVIEYPRDDKDVVLLGNSCRITDFTWTGDNKMIIWSECPGWKQGFLAFVDLTTKKVEKLVNNANRPIWTLK